MKKSFVILVLFMVCTVSYAVQVVVCPSCDIKTIADGIAMAQSGDEILVKEGVYKEHDLELTTSSVKLKGEGNPVIDGELLGTILRVQADSFSIEGIGFINVGHSYTKDYAAILVARSNHFYIAHNYLEDVFFGILIEKSHYGTIEHNEVIGTKKSEANSGNGIHIWHSSDLKIRENKLHGMRDGLYFEFVDNAEIYNNYSYGNIRYGLHFMFSNHDEYYNNIFSRNGAGVAVMFSKFIVMHHNRFEFNWGTASYGLLLKEIYDAEIYENIFEQNTVGINGEGSTRINYTNNQFLRNGWAVKITGACYVNIFVENDFSHNAFDLAFDGHLNGSKFDHNYWSEYTGYDLDKNGIGDVPYRPVKLFSYIVNRTPETIILLRSLFVDMINFSEKVSPVFTPDNLLDNHPLMVRPEVIIE